MTWSLKLSDLNERLVQFSSIRFDMCVYVCSRSMTLGNVFRHPVSGEVSPPSIHLKDNILTSLWLRLISFLFWSLYFPSSSRFQINMKEIYPISKCITRVDRRTNERSDAVSLLWQKPCILIKCHSLCSTHIVLFKNFYLWPQYISIDVPFV
jgi:hypothetical protein